MRALRITMMGLMACLLMVTQGISQFDSGGRGRSLDPNKFFDGLAHGKDVWLRSETSPALQPMFDKIAERLGATDGKITREQFVNNMNSKMKTDPGAKIRVALPPTVSPDKAPGNPLTDPNLMDARAEESFRRLDRNRDGLLDYNEMPEELRNERDQWDADQNGAIDLNEYKAYFRARSQRILDERNQAGAWPSPSPPASGSPSAPSIGDARVKVYHYDNLPKELPSWFRQLDTNHDAQVALYEWKASGRSLEEFMRMDRNNDGFLTVEEVLWYQSHVAGGKTSLGAGGSINRLGGPVASDRRGPRPGP